MAKWISLLEVVYPIGSIYQSTKSVSPASIVGGTWEQITEKFLFAAGNNYACGQTGGEEEHILTTDEIPAHNHDINLYYHSNSGGNSGVNRSQWTSANDAGGRFITASTGGAISQQHATLLCHLYLGESFLVPKGVLSNDL